MNTKDKQLVVGKEATPLTPEEVQQFRETLERANTPIVHPAKVETIELGTKPRICYDDTYCEVLGSCSECPNSPDAYPCPTCKGERAKVVRVDNTTVATEVCIACNGTGILTPKELKLPPLICDVCGKPAHGVYASAIGPISFAYCLDCGKAHAEPYNAVVATLCAIGGRENGANWFKHVIEASLKVAGKTLEELDADVAKAMEEEEKEYQRMQQEDIGED